MDNKNNKLVSLIVIIIICLILSGLFVLYKVLSDVPISNVGGTENNNQQLSGDNNNELKNYSLTDIKNVVVMVPLKNTQDPEMKSVVLTNNVEIKKILLNVDAAVYVGKISQEIGFINNVTIEVNYNSDPSVKIIILNSGNLAINYGVGAGESGYAEYSITNKKLAAELTEKYNN